MNSKCMMHLEKTGVNIHHLIDTTVDELGSEIYPMSDVTELEYSDTRQHSPWRIL